MAIVIRNGVIANAYGCFRADILIENDRIAQIESSIECANAECIDAEGCFVMPGFIDTHTHFDLDTGSAVTADDFVTGTRAAILGGTTTILDFATQDRDGTLTQAYEKWQDKARGSSCNYGFHMAMARFDESVSEEMQKMHDIGITSYKLYMVYDSLKVDDGAVYMALKRAKELGSIIGVHCENYDLLKAINTELHKNGAGVDPYSHALSRPNEVEAEAVAKLIYIARLADAPVNIVHLSTEEAMLEVRRHRACFEKPYIYVETCPQYLLLNDDKYHDDGRRYIMSPPLRKQKDVEALWDALEDGNVDTIGTDHCSFTLAQKNKCDYSDVPNGIPGVMYRPSIMLSEGLLGGRCSIEKLVKLMSYNPAKLYGLTDRGEIKVGAFADMTIWSKESEHVLTDTNHAHNCDYSPYAGLTVRGTIRDVILNGRHVVHGGELLVSGSGHYIARDEYTDL